jgi:hypothetical protein
MPTLRPLLLTGGYAHVPVGTQLRNEHPRRFVLDSIQCAARTKVRSSPLNPRKQGLTLALRGHAVF